MGRGKNDPVARFAASYFLNTKVVYEKLDRATAKSLRTVGALTRVVAKRSLKKPRQMKLSEMSPRQVASYRKRQKIAKLNGWKRPYRPLRKAKPGDPPKNRSGALKNAIFFGYDAASKSTVIGPVPLHTKSAHALEHGGTVSLPDPRGKRVSMTFAGNPFMSPALEEVSEKIPEHFNNIF